MLELVLLSVLALSIVGGYILSLERRRAAARMWPAEEAGHSRSEPAEEGARITEDEPLAPPARPPKAA